MNENALTSSELDHDDALRQQERLEMMSSLNPGLTPDSS